MAPPILLAVPNISEGRDARTIAAVAEAFAGGRARGPGGGSPSEVHLLDVHSDADHHRSVFTMSGRPGELADALLCGADVAVSRIDVMRAPREGADDRQHPYVGAIDVVPVVYLDPASRGAACAEALVVADRVGVELGVPVFLYGELTGSDDRPARTRTELRRDGPSGLAGRIARRELPDFGPPRLHPTAGAALVAARAPLVAFNLQLAPPATVVDARNIAGLIREGGPEGLPGVRAIGVALSGGRAQVSMNLERPLDTPLADVVEAVSRHARVASAELVGLAPRVAVEGFPQEVQLPGFDPARHVIENALGF